VARRGLGRAVAAGLLAGEPDVDAAIQAPSEIGRRVVNLAVDRF
jgi:hypothetical protein